MEFPEVERFHGHSCFGLAVGFRVAQIAMRWLKAERARDEEIVAIVENKSCAVDAIQFITGCTLGKGNLFVKDYGKHVYTFARRPSGKGVRIALKHEPFSGVEGRGERTERALSLREGEDL
jgi:formylmethanofuran dehydrogenase subunit E